MILRNRKVLLSLYNPTSQKLKSLEDVKLDFLPANTIKYTQTLD